MLTTLAEERDNVMKRTFVVLAVLVAFAAPAAFAQFNTSSANANAAAKIIQPISISKTTDLNFASVVPSGSTGTVVVTAAGGRSATGGATLGSSTGLTQAVFSVTGEPSATYTITLPSSISISDGASHSMTVDTFTSDVASPATFPGAGSQALNVGATLNVGISQVAGSYTGTFSVTVTYN